MNGWPPGGGGGKGGDGPQGLAGLSGDILMRALVCSLNHSGGTCFPSKALSGLCAVFIAARKKDDGGGSGMIRSSSCGACLGGGGMSTNEGSVHKYAKHIPC